MRAYRRHSAALLALAILASTAGSPSAFAEEVSNEAVGPAAGFAGAYLAGRAADADSDVDAAARYYAEALRASPNDVGLQERAMVAMVSAARFEQAAEVAERLAEAVPDHRVAALVLAVEEIKRGDFRAVQARIEATPDAFHPLLAGLLDAWAAYGLGQLEEAEAGLKKLEGGELLRLFGRYHLGLMQAAAGESEAALESFSAAAEALSRPSSRLARAWTAELERLGREDEALAILEEAAGGDFGDPAVAAELARMRAGGAPPAPLVETAAEGAAEALFGLAGVLTGDAGRRFALAYARLAAELRPELPEAQLMIAELLSAVDRKRLALAAYDAVPPDSPFRLRAQIGRADALRSLERDEAAAEALRALVAIRPDEIEPRVALADQLRRMERWSEAAAAYSEAIDLQAQEDRQNWALYYQRGIAHERNDEWESAEADFQKALELQPDQALVLNYLGYSWVDMGMRLDEAKAMIERAVELQPNDGYITDSLGWALYRLGDYGGAVEHLERAVELVPDDPVINDHLGDAYWKVGRHLEAEFQWRRARSFDPEPEDLARIKRKLSLGLDRVEAEEGDADEPRTTPSADGG